MLPTSYHCRLMSEPGPIHIRASSDADLTAIHAIYAHYVLSSVASFEYEPPTVSEMSARRQTILSSLLSYLVAVDPRTSAVCGYAYASVYRPRPGYRFTVESSVYVDGQWRRRGVGSALMTALIDQCASKGFKQMVAIVTSGHESTTGSLALHTALGFRTVGVLSAVGYKFGQWLDTTVFQIAIERTAATTTA